jgi:hypothetical protein
MGVMVNRYSCSSLVAILTVVFINADLDGEENYSSQP